MSVSIERNLSPERQWRCLPGGVCPAACILPRQVNLLAVKKCARRSMLSSINRRPPLGKPRVVPAFYTKRFTRKLVFPPHYKQDMGDVSRKLDLNHTMAAEKFIHIS